MKRKTVMILASFVMLTFVFAGCSDEISESQATEYRSYVGEDLYILKVTENDPKEARARAAEYTPQAGDKYQLGIMAGGKGSIQTVSNGVIVIVPSTGTGMILKLSDSKGTDLQVALVPVSNTSGTSGSNETSMVMVTISGTITPSTGSSVITVNGTRDKVKPELDGTIITVTTTPPTPVNQGSGGDNGNNGTTTTNYTVTFSVNGGTGTAPSSQTKSPGSVITLPTGTGLTKTGFSFGGWNTSANGTGTNYSSGASYTVTANVTLYAKWNTGASYTVTFNVNGGTGTAPSAQTTGSGSVITLPAGTGLSKTGSSFGGWNTNAGGTGTNYSAGGSYTVTANVTLYAKWNSGSGGGIITNDHNTIGLTVPVAGATPVTTINRDQYTGTVAWAGTLVSGKFNCETVYTATITLTAKTGYTFQDLPANFFLVDGANTVTSSANSGVVTAVFPATTHGGGSNWTVSGNTVSRTCSFNTSHTESGIFASGDSNDFSFELINNNGAAVVRKGSSPSGNIVIPSYYKVGNNYVRVTSIGITGDGNKPKTDYAFYGCTNITSVTIPETVTLIGYGAFYECTNLSSITIPKYVTSIYDVAFWDSGLTSVTFAADSQLISFGSNVFWGTGLTSVTIPASVTSIGNAFSHCASLKTITFPADSRLTSIDKYAFNLHESLETVTFGTGSQLTSIGESAFSWCEKLKTVTFAADSQLKTIGKDAFNMCKALTTITIPASVTSIDQTAFYGCENLTTVTFAAGSQLTTISGGLFWQCFKLNNVTLPSSVTVIDENAFYGCISLTSFTLPTNLTTIGTNAFQQIGVASITIPASVTSIGDHPFRNTASLTSITVASGNPSYSSEDGVLYNKAKTRLIQYPIGNTRTSFDIPSGVTSIGSSAFEATVSSLTSVTIPDSVTSISPEAFVIYGLTEIICHPTIPPDIGENVTVFQNTTPIKVPAGSVDAYKAAPGWSAIAHNISAQ